MNKKLVIISIIISIIVVITVTLSSYAYFTMPNNKGEDNIVTSGTMSLHFTDGTQINANGMVPGQHIDKEFTVENTGTVQASYDIYLSEVINNFVDKTDLVYEIISVDGGYNTSNQIQVPSVPTKIINGQTIGVGDTHHYILRITFLNKDENQDDNQGVFFSAKVNINHYDDINTVVKYYLDNVEVAELPNQSSSTYLSSNCNNNGTITFNENNWTYNTKIYQNNTTCNIYFERNIVTVTYEAGSGSVSTLNESVSYGGYATLPVPTAPTNYSFIGWFTEENGSGTKIDNTTPITDNMTLYAYYGPSIYCSSGSYLPANLNSCSTCPANSYCLGGNFAENNYDQGIKSCSTINYLYSDSGSDSPNDCYIIIEGGYYKNNSVGTTTSICNSGTYRTQHNSYYNEEDSCLSCTSATSDGATSCTCTYTKSVSIGKNNVSANTSGSAIGTYLCENGVAHITSCKWSGSPGGNVNCNSTSICTSTSSSTLLLNSSCNSSIPRDNGQRSYVVSGAAMLSQESCSC